MSELTQKADTIRFGVNDSNQYNPEEIPKFCYFRSHLVGKQRKRNFRIAYAITSYLLKAAIRYCKKLEKADV